MGETLRRQGKGYPLENSEHILFLKKKNVICGFVSNSLRGVLILQYLKSEVSSYAGHASSDGMSSCMALHLLESAA